MHELDTEQQIRATVDSYGRGARILYDYVTMGELPRQPGTNHIDTVWYNNVKVMWRDVIDEVGWTDAVDFMQYIQDTSPARHRHAITAAAIALDEVAEDERDAALDSDRYLTRN